MFKKYYRLAKPGIIYGNLISAVGGFFYASQGTVDVLLFIAMAAGTSLVIGSACSFNNVIDRSIDAKMSRTQKRALVNGDISVQKALIFAALLGVVGLVILGLYTNITTFALGIIGFVSYVFIYTYSKRVTHHSTLIGSIPGATPIAAGYTSVTGRFDTDALILFVIMVIWQMPHFYAIAIFRREDYAAARIPILSVAKSVRTTKAQILAYIALFIPAVAALTIYGQAGYVFLGCMLLLSLYWFHIAVKGMQATQNEIKWARKVFGASLLVLLGLSIILSLDAWFP